ncbi:hypothetical protein RND71_018314 [Anisodus tanguticus]|uniref:Uncharacterized protein n=1 Tax=Anisodus tanguticus TaxID=243964 RepID=A0AAE1S400_9SOLA|nr:hypothetical protein RND71_018314 [Anisodus tanguticus]
MNYLAEIRSRGSLFAGPKRTIPILLENLQSHSEMKGSHNGVDLLGCLGATVLDKPRDADRLFRIFGQT